MIETRNDPRKALNPGLFQYRYVYLWCNHAGVWVNFKTKAAQAEQVHVCRKEKWVA